MSEIPPNGQVALFLTGATCELFECIPGNQATAENPIIRLKKEKLLLDIQTRRAISDFQPYKEMIQVRFNEMNLICFRITPKTS